MGSGFTVWLRGYFEGLSLRVSDLQLRLLEHPVTLSALRATDNPKRSKDLINHVLGLRIVVL